MMKKGQQKGLQVCKSLKSVFTMRSRKNQKDESVMRSLLFTMWSERQETTKRWGI